MRNIASRVVLYLCFATHSIKPNEALLEARGVQHQVYDQETIDVDISGYTEVWLQLPPMCVNLANMTKIITDHQKKTEPVRVKVFLLETMSKRGTRRANVKDWLISTAVFGKRVGTRYFSWGELGFVAPLGVRVRCHLGRQCGASEESPLHGRTLDLWATGKAREPHPGQVGHRGVPTPLESQRVPDRNAS